MVGGRQSDYALIVRKGVLELVPANSSAGPPAVAVDFRFSGGTTVEDDTTLAVNYGSSLHSDVVVQLAGRLDLLGAMTGDATNHGNMWLGSRTLVGNVVNDGVLTPGSINYEDVPTSGSHIEGAFSQSPAGTLDAAIEATSGGIALVAGRADIDGTLRLIRIGDYSWGWSSPPTAPFSVHVLHAGGGVFGRFAAWTSPGLLITGNLRYLDSDVFFDVTSISVAK